MEVYNGVMEITVQMGPDMNRTMYKYVREVRFGDDVIVFTADANSATVQDADFMAYSSIFNGNDYEKIADRFAMGSLVSFGWSTPPTLSYQG